MARVEPRALFDPAHEGPPADAIDVQLRLPRSLQVWCADQAAAGRWDALGSLQDLVLSFENVKQKGERREWQQVVCRA